MAEKEDPASLVIWHWIIKMMGKLADLAEQSLIELPMPTQLERQKFRDAVDRFVKIVTKDLTGKS